jgi:xanthosine utilization system XapX-like protein
MTAVLLALGAAVGWGVLVPLIAVRGDGPPSTLRIVYAVLAGITDVAGISAL